MSRKLYICSTVYQLVVAVHIKMTIHSKSDADIILTDEMPNVSTIAAKLNSKKIFMSIFHLWISGTTYFSYHLYSW